MSVIRLEAKGMWDGIKPPKEAAEQIIGEVDLLSNLVHDLNWLAETDSGVLRLEMDFHDLGQLLTTEVERWQLPAQAAEIELELQPLPDDLPLIPMDTARISQALGNLIENALQHTPADGRVTIACQSTDDYLGTVRTEFFEVSICDSGPGIPAEDLPHVFERFYRVDPSRQKGSGGRGLGLAIVKQIVEAHQGKVWVESELETGSSFYFSLPV